MGPEMMKWSPSQPPPPKILSGLCRPPVASFLHCLLLGSTWWGNRIGGAGVSFFADGGEAQTRLNSSPGKQSQSGNSYLNTPSSRVEIHTWTPQAPEWKFTSGHPSSRWWGL